MDKSEIAGALVFKSEFYSHYIIQRLLLLDSIVKGKPGIIDAILLIHIDRTKNYYYYTELTIYIRKEFKGNDSITSLFRLLTA